MGLKRALSKHPAVYAAASKALGLMRAIGKARLDVHDFREATIRSAGGQDMTRHDKRFFAHVLRSKITGSGDWLIVDVGGHNGWFIHVVRRFVGSVPIRSYEPLPSKQAGLLALGGVDVHNKAVGAAPGTLTVHEYGSTGLSSVLGLAPGYAYSHHYDTALKQTTEVETVTLDNELAGEQRQIFLKIDVQGYEAEVLMGAQNLLASGRVKVVVLELMTVEKYAGATLYGPIFDMLHAHGFSLFDLNCTYYETETGKLTEFDAAFERA